MNPIYFIVSAYFREEAKRRYVRHTAARIELRTGSQGIPDGFVLTSACGNATEETPMIDLLGSDQSFLDYRECSACVQATLKDH